MHMVRIHTCRQNAYIIILKSIVGKDAGSMCDALFSEWPIMFNRRLIPHIHYGWITKLYKLANV